MFHVKHCQGAFVSSIGRLVLAVWITAFATIAPCRAQTYDLLLQGGHVIDPANKINAVRDVAVKSEKIARVDANIPASEAKKVVDVSGYDVTPGLVDIHTHLCVEGPGGWGIYPDLSALPSGVTTAVDAGTSAIRNCAVS
jgi:dihydroorotase